MNLEIIIGFRGWMYATINKKNYKSWGYLVNWMTPKGFPFFGVLVIYWVK